MSGAATGGTQPPGDIRPGGAQPDIIKPFTIGRTLWHGFGAFFYGIVPITVTALMLLTPVVVIGWLASVWGADNSYQLPRTLTSQLIYFALQLFAGYFYLLASAGVSNVVVQKLRGKSPAVMHTVANLPAIALSVLGLTASLGVILGGLKILLVLPSPVWIPGAVAKIIMFLGLAIVIILLILFFVVIPVIAVDAPGFRTGLYRGYGRSLLLTRGNRWRVFGLLIILFFMFVMIALAIPSTLAGVMIWIDPQPLSDVAIFTIPLEIFMIMLISSSLVIGLMTSFAAVAYWLFCIERDGPATETLEAVFE